MQKTTLWPEEQQTGTVELCSTETMTQLNWTPRRTKGSRMQTMCAMLMQHCLWLLLMLPVIVTMTARLTVVAPRRMSVLAVMPLLLRLAPSAS
jgi:hypothetical protein